MKPAYFFSRLLCTFFVALVVVGVEGCKKDETTSPGGGTTIVPITDDLFPIVPGHKYTYKGWARTPRPLSGGGGVQIPDPSDLYRTVWTIGPSVPTPLGGTARLLVDSTHGPFGSGGADTLVVRNLLVRKDSSTGDLSFLQTLGPFKRAFGIPVTSPTDTFIWVAIARPSQGVGNTGSSWIAFDSTFTGSGGSSVRLQIVGRIIEQMTVVDSSAGHAMHTVYRSRTSRNVTLGGTPIQTDAETSQLWLEPNVGPIWVWIIEDTENLGHYRFLLAKNF